MTVFMTMMAEREGTNKALPNLSDSGIEIWTKYEKWFCVNGLGLVSSQLMPMRCSIN
jgi:hypothetical protein